MVTVKLFIVILLVYRTQQNSLHTVYTKERIHHNGWNSHNHYSKLLIVRFAAYQRSPNNWSYSLHKNGSTQASVNIIVAYLVKIHKLLIRTLEWRRTPTDWHAWYLFSSVNQSTVQRSTALFLYPTCNRPTSSLSWTVLQIETIHTS